MAYIKKQTYIQHMAKELNTSVKGSINELIVCCYYLKKGYEVYRNVSPTGKADIVIWDKKNPPILIDVKMVTINTHVNGDVSIRVPNSTVRGVKTIGVSENGEVFKENEIRDSSGLRITRLNEAGKAKVSKTSQNAL